MSNRFLIIAFFLLIFGLLFFLGRVGLPLAFLSSGDITWRDAGTMFYYLASGPAPVRSVVLGILGHVDGPLQFILLNAYCYAIGDLFPLNPATMQFPNTIFALLACVFAFLLSAKLFSGRFAYCVVLSFVLSPWLAETLRVPWYFNTLSCCLHFAAFYFFVSLMEGPESKFYRIAAPASIFVFMGNGNDWPMFLFALFVFVLLSREWKPILRNYFNLLPLMAIAFWGLWAVILYFRLGSEAFVLSRLIYPFYRLVEESQQFDWTRFWENTILPWGPQLFLSLVGIGLYLSSGRKAPELSSVSKGFLDSMCVWFILAMPPLFASSGHPTFLYVVGMPSAILTALVLTRLRTVPLTLCVLVMLCLQLYYVLGPNLLGPRDEKRRVLAAACYLLDQRPDLLGDESKTYMATAHSGEDAQLVGRYARSRNKFLMIPSHWPATKTGARDAKWHNRKSFVETYNERGEIKADWLILASEALSATNVGRDFFLRLLHDPNVRWIARFREDNGKEIYIGEVAPGLGVPVSAAPLMDVKSLSDRYEAKYDRISFLKANVDFAWRY